MRSVRRLVALGAAALAAGSASAQTFSLIQPTGSNTTTFDALVSADGLTAVATGNGTGGLSVELWTLAGGTVGLGRPVGAGSAIPRGINAAGDVVVGFFGDAQLLAHPFVWTSAGFQALPGVASGMAECVSDDGILVGGSETGSGRLWDRTFANPPINLGSLSNTGTVTARGMSGDGSVLTGLSRFEAFRWTAASGMSSLGTLPGMVSAEGVAVSQDGTAIVGTWRTSTNASRGFRWTQASGMLAMPSTPQGGTTVLPADVSGDGTVIVGSCVDPVAGIDGFIWTPRNGTRLFTQHLQALGVAIPSGYVVRTVTSVGVDGLSFGGTAVAVVGGQSRAFVVSGLSCPTPLSWTVAPISACQSGTLVFSATASGQGLEYRWFRNGVEIVDGVQPSGAVVSNARTAQMTIAGFSAADAGQFTAAVSSQGVCEQLYTPSFVGAPAGNPTFVQQAADTSACAGDSVTLSIVATTASGSADYRWQKFSTPASAFLDITDGPTGTGATYGGTGTPALAIQNVQPGDVGDYRCVVVDTGCTGAPSGASAPATLSVNTGVSSITVTTQPQSVTRCEDPDQAAVFTAGFTPSTGVLLQWEKFVGPPTGYVAVVDGPAPSGAVFAGATTSVLTVSGVFAADAGRYRCVATAVCGGGFAATLSAQLVVETPPALSSVSGTTLACVGRPATLTATLAQGNFGPVTYQWARRTGTQTTFSNVVNGPLPSGATASGATTATLSIAGFRAGDTGDYLVRITGSCGTIESTARRVTSCPGDFDCDGVRAPSDIFAFLNAYFGQCLGVGPPPCASGSADMNSDGVLTPADIFAFLTAYFAGC